MRLLSLSIQALPIAMVGWFFLYPHQVKAAIVSSNLSYYLDEGRNARENNPHFPIDITFTPNTNPPESVRLLNERRGENDGILAVNVLQEKQNVVLDRDINVWNGHNGELYFTSGDPSLQLPSITLSAGTVVSSYLVYINPDNFQRLRFEGDLTFGGEILGITKNWFDSLERQSVFGTAETNEIFGLEGVPYELRTILEREDLVSFSDDTVSISIRAKIGTEPFRVLVAGSSSPVQVPEPLTILGSATALGLGALFKRRSAQK